MKELILLIAKALVDKPEEVKLSIIEGISMSVLELRVAPGDLGKIIGKHGRNAQAIRTILNAVSSKEKRKVVLEILD